MRIKEAIKVWQHNRRKKQYVEKRQKMLAAHIEKWGSPQNWTTEQVKQFEQKRKALYEKEME